MEGVVAHLARIWLSATWRELWLGLGISIESFETLGFRPDSPDSLIWRTCQEQAILLITGNRNAEGPDSLGMVIQGENQPDSLPVITLADAQRVLRERPYAQRTAAQILDYLMRIDEVRGTGRIYVP